MIIDPYKRINFPPSWQVFDCERCLPIANVDYVDDETGEYRQALEPLRVDPETNEIVRVMVKARKITICPGPCIVLVNPIEDDECATVEQTRAIAA